MLNEVKFSLLFLDVIKAAFANTAALIRHALPRRITDLNGDAVAAIPMVPSSILGFNVYEPALRLTKSESNIKARANSTSSSSSNGKRFGRISGLFRKRVTEAGNVDSIEEEEVGEPTLHEMTPVDGEGTADVTSSFNSLPQFKVDPPTSPGSEENGRLRRASASGLKIFTNLKG